MSAIKEIVIRNVRGIQWLRMHLGQVTVLSGSNGVGKSSIIDAIRGAFSGGYDPSWVRDPEAPGAGQIVIGEPPVETGKKSLPHTKGRVEIALTDGSRIIRTADREKRVSTVEVFSADGEVVKAPQQYLDEAFPLAAFDPAHFLKADPKDRQKIVMELLDVPIEPPELRAAVPGDWWLSHFNPRESAFPNLDRIERAARERRQDVNRDLKRINGAIDTLQKGVPTLNQESRDWKKEEADAQQKLAAAEKALAALISDANAETLAARQKIWSETDAETTAVDVWLKAEISKLEEQAKAKRAAVSQRRAEQIGIIEETSKTYIDGLRAEHDPIVAEARAAHEAAKRNLKSYHEATGLREHLATQRREAEEKATESGVLDKAIDNLIALRKKKMEATPIPGMEMRDGIAYYDGLPIDAINTGKVVEVAVRICAASTANNANPFMILDNTESIDRENLEAYVEGLRSAGFQIVLAEVNKENMPLSVEVS